GKANQITHQSLNAGLPWIFDNMPVERMVMAPFAFLGELVSHEQKLLAGMTKHEAVVGAQIGEALPIVARHAADERALAVHNLVMGERQDEVFEKGVMQAEKDLAVMMLAVKRIFADVFERVVYPPYVSPVAESEPAPLHRLLNHWPRRRLPRRRCGG